MFVEKHSLNFTLTQLYSRFTACVTLHSEVKWLINIKKGRGNTTLPQATIAMQIHYMPSLLGFLTFLPDRVRQAVTVLKLPLQSFKLKITTVQVRVSVALPFNQISKNCLVFTSFKKKCKWTVRSKSFSLFLSVAWMLLSTNSQKAW